MSSRPRRVPSLRIRALNEQPVVEEGDYVVYWMITSRRRRYNFGLQRATVAASKLRKPLVVLEALRVGYRWASDRLHRFVMQGMADNARRFDGAPVWYHPWLEPEAGAGRGLLSELASRACMVVTDDYPTFFVPRMLDAAARKLPCRLEAVDANGLLPMRAANRTFARAHDFRRFLHKSLAPHLAADDWPTADPLEGLELPTLDALPAPIEERWPRTPIETLEASSTLTRLPIDHSVRPSALVGGASAADERWSRFAEAGLPHYAEGRNHPDEEIQSGLSPWIHFGHIGAHDVFDRLRPEGWSPASLGEPSGKREGWWNMDAGREAFLDELVTWREIGFNMAHREPDHDRFESLPAWARKTLNEHREDPREHVYDLETFERAETHDEIWNAAQRQLVGEGRIHNYLRMLWGKKILHWSATPEDALEVMVELNNKYALDGRDPNSYSGIFWILGRYDRAWGPEREIFGKVRYMTSDSTRRKLRLSGYLERWG